MRTFAAVVHTMLQLHWLVFGPVVGRNLPDGLEHGGHAADELDRKDSNGRMEAMMQSGSGCR